MRNILFKIVYKIGLAHILRRHKGQSITVLSLHRISNENDFFFNPIKPETFEKLIKYCIKHYEIVPFSEITKPSTKPKLVLSFDDGHKDFIDYAIPILMKYNIPSNHNLINSCLNSNSPTWTQKLNDLFNFLKDNSITDDNLLIDFGTEFNNNWYAYYIDFFRKLLRSNAEERNSILDSLLDKYGIVSSQKMMNWEEAKLCAEKYNVEIGSHTYNHESLFSVKDDKVLDLEILKSITELEHKLQKKIDIFALPNGQYNNAVLEYIEEKEIKFTLLVDNKANKADAFNKKTVLVSRINLINESIYEMILRLELFHSKIRSK